MLNADTSLNLPDFRSSERTFQLLTQVAGRAGRADKEAGQLLFKVIILVIMRLFCARTGLWRVFMPMRWVRSQLSYPPYSYTVGITFLTRIEAEVVVRKSHTSVMSYLR